MGKIEDLIKRINEMEAQAEKARTAAARAEGEIKAIKAQLQKEHGVESLKEAEELLENLNNQKAKAESQLSKLVADLEKKYDWED